MENFLAGGEGSGRKTLKERTQTSMKVISDMYF